MYIIVNVCVYIYIYVYIYASLCIFFLVFLPCPSFSLDCFFHPVPSSGARAALGRHLAGIHHLSRSMERNPPVDRWSKSVKIPWLSMIIQLYPPIKSVKIEKT